MRAEKEKALNKIEAQYRIDYRFETTWQQFDTFNMSIGQGSNNYTVIQLANYVATLANGGYRYQPHLVRRVISPTGEVIKEFEPELIQKVKLKPEILAVTRDAMHYVVLPGEPVTQYSATCRRSFPEVRKPALPRRGGLLTIRTRTITGFLSHLLPMTIRRSPLPVSSNTAITAAHRSVWWPRPYLSTTSALRITWPRTDSRHRNIMSLHLNDCCHIS